MKNKELYSILIVCLMMLSSCLGDTNTRITVGEQEAVYQVRPTKGFYVKDGRFLYDSNLSVSGDGGDCFLIEYSFDSSAPELQGSDSLSIELIGNPISVPLWPLDSQWTDTTKVLKNEVLTESLLKRNAYIRGRLFLWSNHTETESQQDSFMMSYDPEKMYTAENGKRIYNLYLRAIKKVTEKEEGSEGEEGTEPTEEEKTVKVLITNAFNIEEFYNKAKAFEEENGEKEVAIAINYASAYNKDTTACLWSVTDTIKISFNGRTD